MNFRNTPTLITLAATFVFAIVASAKGADDRPNIVLMLADDLGSGDLSCYGSPENETPNLDRLAGQGVRFTDFYAACGVCSPSRASLLSGRFCVRAGVYSWIAPHQPMHLSDREITIATLLKDAGYDTAHVGKWHLTPGLGENQERETPLPDPGDHGFNHWFATENNALPSHHNPINFIRNREAVGAIEGYSCQIVVDEAVDWLESHRDESKPFFLNAWFHEPHQKVASPEKFRKRHLETSLPDYYGCIENMDDAVGRLLAKLDSMGVTGKTLVIFTADNGSYRTDRENNGPRQGRKTQLWEGGIREPGIVRWPGQIKPGTVEETPAGLVDILPTICEAAGAALPADRILDGTSLVPLFAGKALQRPKPLYFFYNPSRPVCAIRDGDWCLIADPEIDLPRQNMFEMQFIGDIKKTALVNFRLYNLREDTGQEQDLAAAQPERTAALRKKMLDLHAEIMAEARDWRTDP